MASRSTAPRVKPLVAVLAFELSSDSNEIQLMPAGAFRALDGRPKECPEWVLDDASAVALIARCNARATPFSLDYDHASLTAAQTGAIAPASGWFKHLEWRPSEGLYAIGVEWTERAAAHIAAREFRFISPVFTYDKSGRPLEIINAALTNNPALDGMDEVCLAALSRWVSLSSTSNQSEAESMDELIEQLRWLLNLPVGATADDIKVQLQKLIDQISGGTGTAAASVGLAQLLADNQARVAALTATQMDPAKFVPIETMQALQAQIATLTASQATAELDGVIAAALSDGRLLPAQESWARALGAADLDKLKAFVASAPRIAALSATQTISIAPQPGATGAELDATTLAVCAMFGNDPAQVKTILEGKQ